MKGLKWYPILALAIATAGVLMSLANQRSLRRAELTLGERRFQVRGEVREIDPDSKWIRMKHDEIPNYMAAMTMPFEVRDPALLRGLKAGDDIGFELVVTKTDSWIASLHRLSEGSRATAAEPSGAIASEIQRVQPGETVPDFKFIDQNGRTAALKDFRGKIVLVTFIYTRCPLPNFCPLISKNFGSLQGRLEKHFPGKFQLLSVSIDPESDRPEVLKDYASRYAKDDSTWKFATGTRDEIDTIGALFGLIQEPAGGLINHDLRTALIAPDGRLVHVWKSNLWTPYEVERRIDEVMNPGQGPALSAR